MRPLYTLILLPLCLGLSAQVPLFRGHPAKSLGNARLKTFAQDREGWMWCGTEEGEVYRYDGLDFQLARRPDSLRSPVTAMADLWNTLWIGYRDGSITCISRAVPGDAPAGATPLHAPLSGMALWQPEEGLPKQPITGFAVDHSGGFWISTYGEGLYVWKNNRLYQFSQADDGMASDDVYALCADHQGRIWAATDAGINICEMPQAGQKKIIRIGAAQGLPDEIVTALHLDQEGNMWAGTHDRGFGCFSTATLERRFWVAAWPYGPVSALVTLGSKEVWIAAEKDGLLRFDRHHLSLHALPEQHPLRKATMRRLHKDREGLLWSISDRGLLYSSNVRYGALEFPEKDIQCVLRDTQGVLWMGTPRGLVRFAEGEGAAIVLPQNVVSLWQSEPMGTLWAGTFDEGVYLLNPAGRVLRRITPADGLPDGSVLSIAGHDGQVWLATLGGVAVSDLRGQVSPVQTVAQQELGSRYVYKIMPDRKGRIWFCTDGKGIAVYEHPQLHYIREANGVELRTIYSAVEDSQGRIWFSADQKGLFCYDGDSLKFRQYTLRNGLHSLNMACLAVLGDGRLTIGYEDGFEVFNPARPDHFLFLDAANGAPSAEVNLNAMYRDGQGNVWMGTRQGVVRATTFDESFLDDPQPALTAVAVFMQPIDFQQQRVFEHDQNYFLFQFMGLWYTQPEAVNYRYRLEGFDPGWRVSKDNQASYSKLPPGRYTFRLQASEHGNFEHVPETSWAFEIKAPIWMQGWFYVVLAAVLAAALWALVKTREARLGREEMLKRKAVEAQFAALKSQINPHFLFNSFNTLITIIEESPPLAVEYVEHLSDFYRMIMAYRERDFITVHEELALVRSFDFLLKRRYERGFQLVNRIAPAQPGHLMPLTLQMLVENAVKHNIISEDKPLVIEIFAEDDGYVTVRNNIRRKIHPEPSTHFGLQSLIRRHQLLGNKPVLVKDDGVFFTVKVPLN